ncbi:hypothetical protein WISP_43648 [Willisornis vidua]|uniref:Vesicle transport protein USE1 n=1 Tax=Willisornis vidua TaxID=1566151 RepID=A0ABQ9DHC1_9PASS|nr:hypothetical protein WISP_43648 [Willisornis vidua]
MLRQLQQHSKPAPELLNEYSRKVDFLKGLLEAEKLTLSHSLRMADQNFEKLKDESDRLEQHAKKSVNWLLWLMLIVVCFIFISMILFIRIFPKLK